MEDRIGFLILKAPSNADAVDWETDCILDNPFFKIDMEEGRSEFQSVDPKKTTYVYNCFIYFVFLRIGRKSNNLYMFVYNPLSFNYNYVIKDGEQEQWTIIFVNCPRSIVSFKVNEQDDTQGVSARHILKFCIADLASPCCPGRTIAQDN